MTEREHAVVWTGPQVRVVVRETDTAVMGCEPVPRPVAAWVLVRLTEDLELLIDHPHTVAALAGVLSEAYTELQYMIERDRVAASADPAPVGQGSRVLGHQQVQAAVHR